LNFPFFSALKNIPNQLYVDPQNFTQRSDFEAARKALLMSNLIKLCGAAFFIGEMSRILKADPKTQLRPHMTKMKWLKLAWITVLSRECLIVGDNLFELYGKRPAAAPIFLHESKIKELANKEFQKWSLSSLGNTCINTCKAAFETVSQPEEVAFIKQSVFIFRTTITEKVFQIGYEVSKNFKR